MLAISLSALLCACAAVRPVSDEEFAKNGTATGLSAKPESVGALAFWTIFASLFASGL